MATGDMKNNIKQLQSELKATKFTQTVDINGLISGSPQTYLGIYHYLFTSYNTQLNNDITNSNNELYGKSDMRFMEAVYKILRDMFDYKPHINREQFFSPGFAERKVIMATDILRLIRRRYKPPKSSTFRVAAARDETSISPREKVEQEPVERPRKIASKLSPDMAGAIVLCKESTSAGGGFKIPKSSVLGQRLSFEGQFFGTPSVTIKNHRDRHVNVPNSGVGEDITEPSAEHSVREHIIKSGPAIDQETPDSIVRRTFLDLVSPALLKVNEQVGKLEIDLMNLEKKEQPKMISDPPSSIAVMSGLMKQMSNVVFKLETLTSRVVLIENRLMMIEARLEGAENNKWIPKENSGYNISNKYTTDTTRSVWSNRNNSNIGSQDEEKSIINNEVTEKHLESNKNISFDGENNVNDLKVVVIREDVKEPNVSHPRMTFIKTLINRNDLENTLESDVSALETSVSKESKQLPPTAATVAKNTQPLFDDTASPIRPHCGSFEYAHIQDESIVSIPCETDNSVSKSDRRSSTPSHFMLDTSTMDRVSRISQMMTDTKQLLH